MDDLANVYLSKEINDIVQDRVEDKMWYIGPQIIFTEVDETEASYLYKVLINQKLGDDLLIADYKLWREADGWDHQYDGKLPVIFDVDKVELFVAVRQADVTTLRKAVEYLADIIDKWFEAMDADGVEIGIWSDPSTWAEANGSLSNYEWY
ncbi:MAG: hypothetical protein K2F99_04415 [Muribaculaceae bacterium]|nr:hypothetical protein [Muribaculaceae bacterium]